MSSRSQPGSGTDSQAPGTDQPQASEIKAQFSLKKFHNKVQITIIQNLRLFIRFVPLMLDYRKSLSDTLITLYRCMKRLARTSTRWRTSELGSVCVMLCRRRSVAPQIRRLCLSRSTGQSFSPSRWHLTKVYLFLYITSKIECQSLSCVPYVSNCKTACSHDIQDFILSSFDPPVFPPRSCALLAQLQGSVRQLERAALGPQQRHPYGHQRGGGQAARHPTDLSPGLQHSLPATDC